MIAYPHVIYTSSSPLMSSVSVTLSASPLQWVSSRWVRALSVLAILLGGLLPAAARDFSHLEPKTQALLKELYAKYQDPQPQLPGYGNQNVNSDPGLPTIFAPSQPRTEFTKYPWKRGIVTTIFWIGESATAKNPVPNNKSSWDTKWEANFGGYDDPNPANRAPDYRPKGFIPGQNPFYIALPYNDLAGWKRPKATAKKIPWFKERYTSFGETVVKGQWVAIRFGARTCYAQWEDVGPFETDDFDYVFGDNPQPKTVKNKGAGLDVSPSVRDFLGLRSGQRCDWRFVELEEVPPGPWRSFGTNNDFVQMRKKKDEADRQAIHDHMRKLREKRDRYLATQPLRRRF